MTRRKVGFAACFALCLLALPGIARAQSSISGTVKDTSGGVLPGVTVEVTSDALIEKTRSTVTDNSGVYRFVDLRPGMYAVKFSLTGFTTVERSGFQLLSDFNARIDADMKVGAMEETITVTGAAPIVDVQSAAKVQTLDRDAIDNIPTGKTIQGIGQLILGVSLNAPDVGGSAGAMQTYMSMRGGSVSAANNTVMVDGMVINGLMLDGAVQTYTNDADFQEMTYQTAGVGADRSGGGVTLNLVPKEGGNRFSGSGAALYRPGQLQADNYTQRLKDWGLPLDKNGDPAINRVDRISDINVTQGGPLQKDKLWFFGSFRDFQPVNTVPNTFLDDGSQGLDDNYIRNALVRLTYQMSPQHKFSTYYERVFKWRGHDMSAFQDPETVALVWTSPNYSTMSAKYTGTISPKLLVEGGFSQNTEYYRNLFQPGIDKARGTPEWFSTASHAATGGGLGVAPAGSVQQFPVSIVYQGSASYVTGQHHAKVGFQWKWGQFLHGGDGNADLQQGYNAFSRDENYNILFPTSTLSAADFASAFPVTSSFKYTPGNRPCNPTDGTASVCTATIRNSPRLYQETLNKDLGIYAQDSFTMKRLTINAGIRYEQLNSQVDVTTSPEGRWVAERTTNLIEDVPDWADWAPRFQLVYDVFGNSKTAVKYSFNRYNEGTTTGVASDFNPIALTTSSRAWTDLNNDDIAQGFVTFDPAAVSAANPFGRQDCVYLTAGCEIYLSGPYNAPGTAPNPLSLTYGSLSEPGEINPFPRRYRLEQGVELQHALLPRLSLTGTYYHGSNHNLTKTVNRGRTDDGTKGTQYRAVNLFNPIDGTPYLYYNSIVTIPTDNLTYLEPLRQSEYDSYTAEMRMRPYAGAQISGGIEFTRTMSKNCGTSALKQDGSPAIVDPNEARFCDDWNSVAYAGGPQLTKPYNKNFKMSGTFPTVYGINLGLSYQNIDSGNLSPTFRYGTAFKYPGQDTNGMLSAGSGFFVPACPATFGCTAGATNVPSNWVGTAAGSAIGSQFPGWYIGEERIVQLDLKASKNMRFGRVTVQPQFEAFNLMNIDQIRSRNSSEYGNQSGTYLLPQNMLQGRILGFGANLRW